MALPTKEILFKRRCVKDPICPWCGEFNESLEHMLFLCRRARAVWFCSPLALRVNMGGLNAIEDWIKEFLWKNKNFEERDKTLFACLCWGIWKDRCNLIFNGDSCESLVTSGRAVVLTSEYWGNLLNPSPYSCVNNLGTVQKCWSFPEHDIIKINVDGSFSGADVTARLGIIARDSNDMHGYYGMHGY